MFFGLFTIYRVLMYPYICVKLVHTTYYSWHYIDFYRKIAGVLSMASIVTMYLL